MFFKQHKAANPDPVVEMLNLFEVDGELQVDVESQDFCCCGNSKTKNKTKKKHSFPYIKKLQSTQETTFVKNIPERQRSGTDVRRWSRNTGQLLPLTFTDL